MIEAHPKDPHAGIYRNLSTYIAESEDLVIPNPLGVTELKDWAREWGDKIYDLETGVISGSEAI